MNAPKCSLCGDVITDIPLFMFSDTNSTDKYIHSHHDCFQEITKFTDYNDAYRFITENKFDLNTNFTPTYKSLSSRPINFFYLIRNFVHTTIYVTYSRSNHNF